MRLLIGFKLLRWTPVPRTQEGGGPRPGEPPMEVSPLPGMVFEKDGNRDQPQSHGTGSGGEGPVGGGKRHVPDREALLLWRHTPPWGRRPRPPESLGRRRLVSQ